MVEGRLQPIPMQRGKNALAQYLQTIEQYGCDRVLAFATSGIRSTANGKDFVMQVKQELGLDISVIDGNQEAELIYDGVDLAVGFGQRPQVVIDIGGGSTEFIIADHTGILWKRSYDLGISRVNQQLQPSDPVCGEDLDRFDALLYAQLTDLISECQTRGVRSMVGSSGSFDSFIEMIWASKGLDRKANDVVSDTFDMNELQVLHDRLIGCDHLTRSGVPGLVPMRVDTIHLASYLVQWVVKKCQITELVLSSYSLKEGVIHRVMDGRF